MDANLILSLIPQRAVQRNIEYYETDHLELQLKTGESRDYKAQNQVFFLIGDAPPGLVIQSEYGQYNLDNFNAEVQQHEHSGNIQITNQSAETIHVKFFRLLFQQ